MIDWNTTKEERLIIFQISSRAVSLIGADLLTTTMDIVAVHLNGCPLDLNELAAADDFSFIHDIEGIARHLDRATGRLQNCFVPRFARESDNKN